MYLPICNHQLCTQLLYSKVPKYLVSISVTHTYTHTSLPSPSLPKRKKKKLVIIVIVIVFFFFSSKFGPFGVFHKCLPSTYMYGWMR